MAEPRDLGFQAMVDLLDRREPAALENLRRRYPAQVDVLRPGRRLGAADGPSAPMLRELARSTIDIAKNEGAAVSRKVRRRMRLSSRLRLAGAIVSALSSAGLLAALMQGSTRVALASGAVAFASSCFTLVAQYVEDFAGGQNSLRELRDRVMTHSSQILEADGDLGLMTALDNFTGLEDLVRKLNVAVASLRQIEMAVD